LSVEFFVIMSVDTELLRICFSDMLSLSNCQSFPACRMAYFEQT